MNKFELEKSYYKSINDNDIDRTLQFLLAATNDQENYKELLNKLKKDDEKEDRLNLILKGVNTESLDDFINFSE